MIRTARLRANSIVTRHCRSSLVVTSTTSRTFEFDGKKKGTTNNVPHFISLQGQCRGFATNEESSTTIEGISATASGSDSSYPSFDDTMSKLFDETSSDAAAAVVSDAASSETAAAVFEPTWYNFADQAIRAINFVHDTTGLEYGMSIIALTAAIRVVMLPLFVKSQQNTSRMAHMQPEMQAIKQKLEALGPNPDKETQLKYGLQMKALFQKYDCNPFRAVLLPFVQMPVFMGMFFGLRKMPDYFPDELATGGMLWFPDLTVPDPLLILPVGSALSFLIMMELSKDQMMASNPQQGQIMINVFRGMGFIMIPVACNFSSAILCYWVANNTISLFQSLAFRNAQIRKQLGIWDPPKPVPGMTPEPKGIAESIQGAIQKAQGKAMSEQEEIRRHNETIESKKKAAQLMKESASPAGRKRRRGRRTSK